MDPNSLIDERGKTHGDFRVHAGCTQDIINVMEKWSPDGKTYTAVQLEALHMIAHKIGRIIAGDQNHVDHWLDVSGYSMLVVQDLTKPKE